MVPGDVDELDTPGGGGLQLRRVAGDEGRVLDGEQGRGLAALHGAQHIVPARAVDDPVAAFLQLPDVAVVIAGGLREALLRRDRIRVVKNGEHLSVGRERAGLVQGDGSGTAAQAAALAAGHQGVAVGVKIGDLFHGEGSFLTLPV